MSDDPDRTLVHARYLGDTDVVFPHLIEGPRCCREENHRELERDEEGNLVTAPALVKPGDVFLIDRYSAEGREDLEVLDLEVLAASAAEEPEPAPEPKPSRRASGKTAARTDKE
jgi:hypothetical protein